MREAWLLGLCLCSIPMLCLWTQFSFRRPPSLRPPPGPAAYSVNVSLLPKELASTFILSDSMDSDTRSFLAASQWQATSYLGRWSLFLKHIMFTTLIKQLGWTRVDASSFVGRAQMFVASPAQLKRVLHHGARREPGRLLDIGAGRGDVTSALANALRISDRRRDVLAVESSQVLRRELRQWGFRAIESLADLGAERVDTVALFNVLDRVNDPEGLLRAAAGRLRQSEGGLLVVATVLPFHGLIQLPRGRRRQPQKPLKLRSVDGRSSPFEHHAATFVEALVRSTSDVIPLKLLTWTRLPYLSSADVERNHYVLDNALFVLGTPTPVSPATAGPSRRLTAEPSRRLGLLHWGQGASQTYQRNASSSHMHDAEAVRSYSARKSSSECGPPDQIFSWISKTLERQGVSSWGTVLDAGTGRSSLCWIVKHKHTRVDAVTAASSGIYSQNVAERVAHSAHAEVNVILGNWKDEKMLAGRQYDVVVADFLIGAVESFWPFGQDEMFARLLDLVRPGGYLLFVGLEPYELVFPPTNAVRRIEALGDAAALLAGGASYREMPQEWVRRQLQRHAGFKVVSSQKFTSNLGQNYVNSQLGYASKQALRLPSAQLRDAFLASARSMRSEAAQFEAKGYNYAIVARREILPRSTLV